MTRILRILCVAGLCATVIAVGAAQTVGSRPLVDRAELLSDLATLAADDMEGRQVGTPGGARARAFIVGRFKASGLVPFGASYEHPFTFTGRGAGAGERRGVNVLGRIDGTRQPARYIVVSAHYDHVGVRDGQVFNGADDNASGTAALFAMARHFSARRPAHSLIVAAFDGEEAGMRGSRAFVRQPPVDAGSLALDLNIDMIGREDKDRLFVVGTSLYPFLRPAVEALAARAPVKLLMGHDDPARPEDWTRQSDHYAFIEAKIPALYFGVEDFDQHHKATDDVETMTPDFYVRAVETLILAVEELDARLDQLARR
jgi:Zn-dependent M28 family amino/carboxypeptidase